MVSTATAHPGPLRAVDYAVNAKGLFSLLQPAPAVALEVVELAVDIVRVGPEHAAMGGRLLRPCRARPTGPGRAQQSRSQESPRPKKRTDEPGLARSRLDNERPHLRSWTGSGAGPPWCPTSLPGPAPFGRPSCTLARGRRSCLTPTLTQIE